MFLGLSAELFIDMFDTLGFGFLFAGILCSAAFVFWTKKIKWIFAALSFFLSAASFLVLAWFIPGFAWDVVPFAVADIIVLTFCLRAGAQAS